MYFSERSITSVNTNHLSDSLPTSQVVVIQGGLVNWERIFPNDGNTDSCVLNKLTAKPMAYLSLDLWSIKILPSRQCLRSWLSDTLACDLAILVRCGPVAYVRINVKKLQFIQVSSQLVPKSTRTQFVLILSVRLLCSKNKLGRMQLHRVIMYYLISVDIWLQLM